MGHKLSSKFSEVPKNFDQDRNLQGTVEQMIDDPMLERKSRTEAGG